MQNLGRDWGQVRKQSRNTGWATVTGAAALLPLPVPSYSILVFLILPYVGLDLERMELTRLVII